MGVTLILRFLNYSENYYVTYYEFNLFVGWFERSEIQRKKSVPINISVQYYRLTQKVPSVGWISEAPSDTVKYLANLLSVFYVVQWLESASSGRSTPHSEAIKQLVKINEVRAKTNCFLSCFNDLYAFIYDLSEY